MKRHVTFALVVCLFAATAQAQQQAKVLITVADPSGAVIPGATVTVTQQDGSAKAAPVQPATTSQAGLATIEGLAPGRYMLTAEFPGFEPVTIKDYRVRAGDNRRNVVLPLKKVAEDVVVG